MEMPRQSQEKNHYNELILTSLNRLRNKPKTTVTYGKTVKSVSEYNHVPYEKVKLALDNLLKQKYILEKNRWVTGAYGNRTGSGLGSSECRRTVDRSRVRKQK